MALVTDTNISTGNPFPLSMVGLGVLNDTPPDEAQPRLVDGIHLRWAFRQGFPWYGFYLYRRKHGRSDPICIGGSLKELGVSSWPGGPTLDLPYGRFRSDQPIIFADNFPPSGAVEFDLEQRNFLRFDFRSPYLSRWVEVHIGFLKQSENEEPDRICINFTKNSPARGANPRTLKKVQFQTLKPSGKPADETRAQGWRNKLGKVRYGLDCDHALNIDLPSVASTIELTLTHFSVPAIVTLLDRAGHKISETKMTAASGVPETIALTGTGTVRAVVSAPKNEVLLHRICFGGQPQREVRVTALLGNIPVARHVVRGRPGEVVSAVLEFDAITAVHFSRGPATLLRICFIPVGQGATLGWEPVPGLRQPMCLPVAENDYPCPTKPATKSQAEDVAVARVLYGDRPPDPPGEAWRGQPFEDLHGQLELLVDNGSAGGPMYLRGQTNIAGVANTPDPNAPTVALQQLNPLDLTLLMSVNPAMAQMVGLYWADQTVEGDTAYDYMIVADQKGVATGQYGGDPLDVLDHIVSNEFADVDAYIVFNKRMAQAPPLDSPADVRTFALPGSTFSNASGALIDAQNNAGLRWGLGTRENGKLLPGGAILYHIWRKSHGQNEPTALPPPSEYDNLITTSGPISSSGSQQSPGASQQSPSDWPPFPFHRIDRGLPDGWYSYRVTGVDIFGRHSPRSAPAVWYQWAPAPVPEPWYYENPPADSAVHPHAIALLDKIPPPPPEDVQAYPLDPEDRFVQQDQAYDDWRSTLSAQEQQDVVGLRVRWAWTAKQMEQAPDTNEFRIYYKGGRRNAILGSTVSVTAASTTVSNVATDIPNSHPADTFVGTRLRVGQDFFEVIGSDAADPLRLRVRNVGVHDEIGPAANTPCTISIPGQVPGANPPASAHPLFVDYGVATNWDERFYVVGYDEYVDTTPDADGNPLRSYEVFLPAPGDADRTGLPLAPSLTEPVAYAHIGVTAVDDKTHTGDDSKWDAGNWGDRFGNESRLSAPWKIYRAHRDPPPAPAVPPPDSDHVFASPANYHSHSYYTYRWTPVANLKTHIYRALDDAVFKTDWATQPRPPMGASDVEFFPDELTEPLWNGAKRQQVADELNQLNSFTNDDTGKAQATTYYRGLSNDALRVLPGLPGNERAFAQLTIRPMDPDEPDTNAPSGRRWRRVGPDVAPDVLDGNPELRAYIDALDGRSTSRYFYRSAYVDNAHNLGAQSLCTAPVYLPNVTSPRAPVVTKILGGDRQITLRWASNREPDLVEYRIYRTDVNEYTRDLRLMTRVHVAAAPAGDPALRPGFNEWSDNIPGGVDMFYRLVAVDVANNVSSPSRSVLARAYDYSSPAEPTWARSEWIKLDADGNQRPYSETTADLIPTVVLNFSSVQANIMAVIQRQVDGNWRTVTSWIRDPIFNASTNEWQFTATDRRADPGSVQLYRAKLMSNAGVVLESTIIRTVPIP